MRTFELPDTVQKRLRANGSESWVDSLPELVAGLAEDWAITVEPAAFVGGSEALVVPATMRDGTEAILKVLIPRDDDVAAHEITAMRLAGGDGCAALYRDDPARLAMLMERLGPTLGESGLAPERKIELMCEAAQRMWRPAAGAGLPTGAEKGRWLAEYIRERWEALGRPCSARAVEYALACVKRRIAAHDDGRGVLVHGDIHEWNALQAGDSYKLIDPDGLLAEPEYDLGVIARLEPEASIRANPGGLARTIAGLTGRDAVATHEWAVVERLSTAFVCTTMDFQPLGRDSLAAAEAAAETA